MKKLLVILALCMVISVALVACDKDGQSEEQTTAGTTQTPTTEQITTDTAATEEATTEEATTEQTTTDASTTEETTTEQTTTEEQPADPVDVIAGISFDAMGNVYGADIDMENLYFASAAEYHAWGKIAEIDHLVDSLKVAGWVAFFTETEGVLGYAIDGAGAIYPEGFSTPAGQDVLDHIAAGNVPGAKSAARMFSDIPVKELTAGEHTVVLMAKDADGNEESFAEFKLVKTDNSYRVDLSGVTVTGSYSTVYTGANALFPTTPAVGADEYLVTLHYGSIDLGEIDLSKYSKVTVTYATAADGLMPDSNFTGEYGATGQRVLLLNAPSDIETGTVFELLPAEDAIVATAHYDLSESFMAIATVEIDLSAIDYNGQLYLSFDFRNSENAFGALGYLLSVTGIVFE